MSDHTVRGATALPTTELESCLCAVEQRLAELGDALRDRNGPAIEQHSSELHMALSSAVQQFALAARKGSVPPALRHRLVRTSGQVAAQRESLARATAALDRAIDVLMPRESLGVYSTQGTAQRPMRQGSILA
jgi:hypothetical protein